MAASTQALITLGSPSPYPVHLSNLTARNEWVVEAVRRGISVISEAIFRSVEEGQW